jgi:hypothetical protein
MLHIAPFPYIIHLRPRKHADHPYWGPVLDAMKGLSFTFFLLFFVQPHTSSASSPELLRILLAKINQPNKEQKLYHALRQKIYRSRDIHLAQTCVQAAFDELSLSNKPSINACEQFLLEQWKCISPNA